jgi:ABC-type amino acid transport system permease subunit
MSERVPAMIGKVSNVEFIVPTVLAAVLAIVLSIGAIYLTEIFLGPIEQVEAHQSGGR